MLNKPEAPATANTKIDSVYKRIKELTHVESPSPFIENRHLFMTVVSLTDESLEIKKWQKTCNYTPLKKKSAVLGLANFISHKPLISKRFIKTKDLCLVPTCLHWSWTLLSPLKHSWSLDLVTESCCFWRWFVCMLRNHCNWSCLLVSQLHYKAELKESVSLATRPL